MSTSSDDEMFIKAVDAEAKGNYKRAFLLFNSLAEKGDTYAMSALSRFYDDKLGVKYDYDLAIHWGLKSAESGNVIGMFNMAVLCKKYGYIRSARVWFEKALVSGDIDAALDLAQLYSVSDKETETVRKYLNMVLKSVPGNDVSEGTYEDAQEMLDTLNNNGTYPDIC